MATNFLELATTLKYLGAKWLPGKKVNFTPCSDNTCFFFSSQYLGPDEMTFSPVLHEANCLLQNKNIEYRLAKFNVEILQYFQSAGYLKVCVELTSVYTEST